MECPEYSVTRSTEQELLTGSTISGSISTCFSEWGAGLRIQAVGIFTCQLSGGLIGVFAQYIADDFIMVFYR